MLDRAAMAEESLWTPLRSLRDVAAALAELSQDDAPRGGEQPAVLLCGLCAGAMC